MEVVLVIINIIAAIISIAFLVRTWVMFNNIKDIRENIRDVRDFLLKDYDVPQGQFLEIVLHKMNSSKDVRLKANQKVTRKDQQNNEIYEIIATGPDVSYVRSKKTWREYIVNNELLVPYNE